MFAPVVFPERSLLRSFPESSRTVLAILANWKHEMNTNEPPNTRSTYPHKYLSTKTSFLAIASVAAPTKRITEPTTPVTYGPNESDIDPTGNADTLVTMHAAVNRKLRASYCSSQGTAFDSPSLPVHLSAYAPSLIRSSFKQQSRTRALLRGNTRRKHMLLGRYYVLRKRGLSAEVYLVWIWLR